GRGPIVSTGPVRFVPQTIDETRRPYDLQSLLRLHPPRPGDPLSWRTVDCSTGGANLILKASRWQWLAIPGRLFENSGCSPRPAFEISRSIHRILWVHLTACCGFAWKRGEISRAAVEERDLPCQHRGLAIGPGGK